MFLHCDLIVLKETTCSMNKMNHSNDFFYLVERSTELFLTFDLELNSFTYMNSACKSFFGLESHNVSTLQLLNMVNSEDRSYLVNKVKHCISGASIADVECRITRGDNFRWLRVSPFLSTDNGKTILIVQAEDITTSKMNVEVLQAHLIKKNSILTMLAHDLAGPLGAIQNFATLLGTEADNNDKSKIKRMIHSISSLSKSSIHLIHTFLDQEFLESANVHLVKKRIDLFDRLKLAFSTYKEAQKRLDIVFDISANYEKIYVELDEDKFMQVINNLVSNSLKFTPAGGRITLSLQKKTESVIITVTDTGIGIPKAFQNSLFDKFTEARRRGLNGEDTTGLGMSIIKTIVEWHDGIIWFESEENVGTSFFIELPVKAA
jgi:two-component system sensor histidine kinase VicK